MLFFLKGLTVLCGQHALAVKGERSWAGNTFKSGNPEDKYLSESQTDTCTREMLCGR